MYGLAYAQAAAAFDMQKDGVICGRLLPRQSYRASKQVLE